MAAEPSRDDDLFDEFLADRGHELEQVRWDRSYNKLQCPSCGALHDTSATACKVCDWGPDA